MSIYHDVSAILVCVMTESSETNLLSPQETKRKNKVPRFRFAVNTEQAIRPPGYIPPTTERTVPSEGHSQLSEKSSTCYLC